ncbi:MULTISPECIES: hypothetical protein [Halorussus]|uniref:hypothetical protein n=1 Tax=Halorussus TaxID=1070314 RepID=UPI0020A0D7B7|nr:hypothetical protein [Halorussus vallis]USZ76041.1 hypothetical protein NGM07_01655 [Halorussus vallis]
MSEFPRQQLKATLFGIQLTLLGVGAALVDPVGVVLVVAGSFFAFVGIANL